MPADIRVLAAKIGNALSGLTQPGGMLDYRPGGPVDVFGRMWTPGVKSVTPSPQDDPFYVRAIQNQINPSPGAPKPPGAGYAQQQAGQFGDTSTAGSTIGVKSQKADKIKKAREK